jgi:hypothetical protein
LHLLNFLGLVDILHYIWVMWTWCDHSLHPCTWSYMCICSRNFWAVSTKKCYLGEESGVLVQLGSLKGAIFTETL